MVGSTKVLFWSSVVLQLVWWLICFELATRNLVILWHSFYAYDLVKLDFVSMPAETRKQSKVNYKSLHLTGCAVSSIENELVERESEQPGFEQFLGIFSPVRKKISSMTENAQNKEGAVAGDIQMKTEVGVGETVQINEEISDSEELELAIAKIQQQKERVKKKIKRKELMARLEQEKSELAELQEKDERTKVGEKSKGKTKTKSEVSKKGEVKKAVSGSSKAVKQKESGSCKSEWIKALETSKDGHVVSGSKQALRQAVLSGSKLRIYTGSYSAGTQNAYAYKDEICAQSLFHISKDGWDRHQRKAYWWFLNLCTTGNVHMSRWYVGSHSQPSNGESKVKYNIKWFVRSANCDTESPVLSNTANGAVTNGSIQSLSDAIDQGYEINVVDGSRGSFSELTNIVRNKQKTLVAGTSLWSVSQTTITSHFEFQSNAYWWFTIWSSDGSRDMSRWNVGQNTDRGHTSDRLPMNWFADTCWTLAYEHDENGLHIDGSLAYLRSAILVGRRVRLVYSNNYAVEADVLVIRNDHVIAQIIGHVSKANLKTFQSDAYWYFENVATTGQVEVIRYNVGSNVNRGSSKRRQSIKWFIDTRHWTNAYSNSETGADLKGSKTSLIQNVADGRAVRFTLKFPSSTGDYYVTVLNADNIDTSPDGNNLAAQHVRFISLQKEGLNGVEFQPNPYWNFVIAATTGRVDESRWTLGKHEGRGHISTNAAIDWFVS